MERRRSDAEERRRATGVCDLNKYLWNIEGSFCVQGMADERPGEGIYILVLKFNKNTARSNATSQN